MLGKQLSGRLTNQARTDALIKRAVHAASQWRQSEIVGPLRAAAEAGDNPRLWQMLAVTLRALGDHKAALVAVRRAETLAPNDPGVVHALARLEYEAGLPAAALYDRAHALAPLQAPILLGRAAAYVAEGRSDDALNGLRHQLRSHPAWYEGHVSAARLRWTYGDRDKFTETFEQAIAGRPNDGLLWRELIQVLLRAELFDDVHVTIARARKAVGASRTLDLLEAVARSEAGTIDLAQRHFDALGTIDDPGYKVHHVRHLLRSDRVENAAAVALASIAGEEGADLWPLLGDAWRLMGDPRADWLNRGGSFVKVYDLELGCEEVDGLAQVLRSIHQGRQSPLDQSVRGGTQTDGPLFSRREPPIQRLRDRVLVAVRDYVGQLPPFEPQHPLLGCVRDALRFAGSWSVRLVDDGRHVDHVHPAGWISSAFYVVLPDGTCDAGSRPGWLNLGGSTALHPALRPERSIEPKVARLVLFPSYMWHGTQPFASGERLTVAFDIARPPRQDP